MQAIQRVTTGFLVLLTVASLSAAQDKGAAYDRKLQAKALNMRGAALVSLVDKPTDKRLTDAEADFRAALAANPELHSAQLNLGVTLLKMGHDEDGVRELKIYVESAPRGPELDNAKRMIEEPRRAREASPPISVARPRTASSCRPTTSRARPSSSTSGARGASRA